MNIIPLLQSTAEIKIAIHRLVDDRSPAELLGSQMLEALLDHLECSGPFPCVIAELQEAGVWFWRAEPIGGIEALVRVDRPDFGPARDGIPLMHYRLDIKLEGSAQTKEVRTCDVEEIEYLIRQAFEETPPMAD